MVFVTAAVGNPHTIFWALNKPAKLLPNTEPHTCYSCSLSRPSSLPTCTWQVSSVFWPRLKCPFLREGFPDTACPHAPSSALRAPLHFTIPAPTGPSDNLLVPKVLSSIHLSPACLCPVLYLFEILLLCPMGSSVLLAPALPRVKGC